jgi:hypothetical protein
MGSLQIMDKDLTGRSALQAEKVEPDTDRSEAYDVIDRFLRNNLDDSDYAEYSDALERVFAAPTPPTNTDEVSELYKMGLAQAATIKKLEALLNHDELREAARAVVEWCECTALAEEPWYDRLRKALK